MNRSFAKRLQLAAASLLLALTSCGEGTTAPEEVWLPDVAPPVYAILDAANDGNPHFYFLPPVVPNPSPAGTFDGSLSPRVEICESDLSGCIADPFAVFTSGEGANDVRVVPEDEHYILNWHTDDWDLTIGSYYRIIVYQASFELGYIDVLVDGQGGGKNAKTGDDFQLKEGRTLPLKIRIEEGAAAMAPASASTPDGSATVQAPPGALQNYEQLTVEPVDETTTELPTNGSALPGTIFDFGPDGLEFEEPVELALAYDPSTLPQGVAESGLRVYLAGPNGWKLLPGGSVDLTTKKVKGLTTHFSSFAILPGGVTSCDGSGFETMEEAIAAVGPEGTITVCDGTHTVEGVVVDKPVTIQAEGTSSTIQTTTSREAFLISNASGTVLFDGLTFDFDTPTGPDIPTRSYAIRTGAAWDQLYVQNTVFEIDPAARGSIFTEASTSPAPATYVDNVDFNGGVFGMTAFDSHAEITGSRINGTTGYGIFLRTATGKVESSEFDGCGSVRCVNMDTGSDVDVLSNVFEAPVLTGDAAPDLNQLVFVTVSSSGSIAGNDFLGCGFYSCVDLRGTVTVTDNDFHHVSGQMEHDFSTVIGAFRSVDAVFDGNRIHSCGVFCYNVGDGANVTIRNETVTVLPGHGTIVVANAQIFDDPAAPANTLVFEDNTVTGSGAERGADVWDTNLTLNRNSFNGLTDGIHVNQGITHQTTLTGRDNMVGASGTGVAVQSGTSVDLQFNDFTGQAIGLESQEPATILTCNWWGDAAGPQNVDPSVPSSVYQPWATMAIAGTGATDCQGGSVRVAASDDGSGLPFYATVAAAVAAAPANGNVMISAGTHAAEGVVIDKPLTLMAEGTSSTIQTTTSREAFLISNASGTVLFDGLTFDFDTPTGPDIPTRSYAIRTGAAWDQLYVQNTVFEIDPAARGSIFTEASTSPAPATYVDNVDFNGGVFGMTAFDSHAEITGSRINGTTGYGIFLRTATGKVESSEFDGCGSVRCVNMDTGSDVDVLSNVFEAPVLTGDAAPDLNQLVFVTVSSSGSIAGNDFLGCGFYSCVDVRGTVTVTDNDFHHVSGQMEHDFSTVIGAFRSVDAVFDGNRIHSCGVFCYNVGDGANVTIRNETVTVLPGHGTIVVANTQIFDDPAAPANTLVFEDNTVTGSGAEGGVEAWDTDLTLHRNSFAALLQGIRVNQGITHLTALTGRDNVVGASGTGVAVQSGTSVDLQFNDFTGQTTGLDSQEPTAVLTCNWWGDAAGPQNVDPSVPTSVYQPWATMAIAGTGATDCQGGSVRVAASDDGSGLPFYATVAAAVAAAPANGNVMISAGTHAAEGVVIDKPLTIQAEGASSTIQTTTSREAFLISNASGAVLIDGLTFDFDTPTGPDIPTRSYAIRTGAAWDQLYVQNTVFEIDPAARGSIFTEASTSPAPATYVDNVDFNGGVFGMTAFDSHAEITGSRINGTTGYGIFLRTATGKVESSEFDGCGSVRCVNMDTGSDVDVLSNVFEAPVLTGDAAPDLNQLVFVTVSSSGSIAGNDFLGCGFFSCVDVRGTVTVTDNDFHHVSGQMEHDFSTVIGAFRSVDAVFDGNRIHSCGVFCYNVGNGANVTIRNETVTVLPGHGTIVVATMHVFDEPTAPANTLVFEDNTVTGSGAEGGVDVWDTNLTLNRNSFNGLTDGILVNQGISYVTTVTGQDNVFGSSGTGVVVQSGTLVDLQFNDFTGQTTGLDSQEPTAVLTCNWWGNVAGPQNVDPSVPTSVFTLWATAPIANGAGGVCDGM